ncbi:MAG: hypothetical protein ACRC9K_24095 [Afipia sp.]
MIATIAGIALITISGAAQARHRAMQVNEPTREQIQPVSREALLRAKADCKARLTKERPDAKILRDLALAVRTKNSTITRIFSTGPDDVLAFVAPATWKPAFGSDIVGKIGCSYNIKDKSLSFRSIEYLRSLRDRAEASIALRNSTRKPK